MQSELPPEDERPVVAVFRSPVFNASETFVRAQAAGLIRYQPVVVGLEDKGHVPPTLAGRILLAENRAAAFGIRALGRWGRLGTRVAQTRPLLLHAHFGTDGLIALPLAQQLGIPLITTLRGYDVTRSRASLFASARLSWMRYALGGQKLMREGQLFLAVSDALRHQAIAQGFPAERILTHYNGVDLTRFHPETQHPVGELTILHIGRLVEKKGTELLLKAMVRVVAKVPAARLIICGDGPLRQPLERLAQNLGIADAVQFRGHTPPAELSELLRCSALLAAPSITAKSGDGEGLPNVVVEAAASGIPIAASDHGGISEAIIDGETGFLVPEHDTALLESRITQLLQSPDLRRKMGFAGRRLTEQRFDSAQQMQLLEQRYDELLARVSEC